MVHSLEDILTACVIELAQAKQELKAIRERVVQEFQDGQEAIDEGLAGYAVAVVPR